MAGSDAIQIGASSGAFYAVANGSAPCPATTPAQIDDIVVNLPPVAASKVEIRIGGFGPSANGIKQLPVTVNGTNPAAVVELDGDDSTNHFRSKSTGGANHTWGGRLDDQRRQHASGPAAQDRPAARSGRARRRGALRLGQGRPESVNRGSGNDMLSFEDY
ncbi:MAG TPA: hypothetical protein VEZ46_04740, partial [Mycobacteriales bacterium]|nr:hypothetical protein [Mycobacteriales bacterium]